MLSGIEAEPVFRSSRIWIAWRMKLWARPTLFQGSLGMERKKQKQIYFKTDKQTNKEKNMEVGPVRESNPGPLAP